MTIYMVEDCDRVRDQIGVALCQIHGVRIVGSAGTADDAIQGIQQLMPDLVLLDLSLHKGVGQDVLRGIGPLLGDIRVVVFSNGLDQVTARHCHQLGAYAVLDKSSQLAQLCEMVAGFVPPPESTTNFAW